MESGKNIILATYNFYPFHWGGSEVYVKGLAEYLMQKGYNVVVVAAMPIIHFNDSPPLYEDAMMLATTYTYEGINVLGAQLKNESTLSIYAKYVEGLAESWKNCLNLLFPGYTWFAIHLHGYTGLINTALFEAVKSISTSCKTCFSYHTPVTCPKGTLLYFGRAQCVIRPNINTCTACILHERMKMPEFAIRAIAASLPESISHTIPLPTSFRIKALVKAAIDAVDRLRYQTSNWYVFSNQISQLLEKVGVVAGKIKMIRHGVENDFLSESNLNRVKGDKNIFLFIGRFEKIKGFNTLLNAWLTLPQSKQKELWIVGENQNKDREIDLLLSTAKNRQDVVLLGKKNRLEIKAILRETHCVIIPSEWVETGPLVFHEAIACGCNIISSSLGGTRELTEYYGKGCEMFKFSDACDLSRKILNFSYQNILQAADQPQSQSRHYEQVELSYSNIM